MKIMVSVTHVVNNYTSSKKCSTLISGQECRESEQTLWVSFSQKSNISLSHTHTHVAAFTLNKHPQQSLTSVPTQACFPGYTGLCSLHCSSHCLLSNNWNVIHKVKNDLLSDVVAAVQLWLFGEQKSVLTDVRPQTSGHHRRHVPQLWTSRSHRNYGDGVYLHTSLPINKTFEQHFLKSCNILICN